MAEPKIKVEILRCPKHPTFFAVAIGDKRIAGAKCCGTWTTVRSWEVDSERTKALRPEADSSSAGMTADELRQIRERCEESRWVVRVEYAGAIHTFGPWDWNRAVTERAGYVNLDQVTAASIEEVESDVPRLLAEVERLTAAQDERRGDPEGRVEVRIMSGPWLKVVELAGSSSMRAAELAWNEPANAALIAGEIEVSSGAWEPRTYRAKRGYDLSWLLDIDGAQPWAEFQSWKQLCGWVAQLRLRNLEAVTQ